MRGGQSQMPPKSSDNPCNSDRKSEAPPFYHHAFAPPLKSMPPYVGGELVVGGASGSYPIPGRPRAWRDRKAGRELHLESRSEVERVVVFAVEAGPLMRLPLNPASKGSSR
jgi:hypothetical protein